MAGSEAGDTSAYPLSYAQQRLWFLHEWDPTADIYQFPVNVRIEGDLECTALARALAAVAERHSILRSSIEVRDGSSS